MDLLSFGLLLALVLAAPGPALAALLVRALEGQLAAAAAFAAGIAGAMIVALTAAATGLGVWIGEGSPLLVAAKVLGLGYLGWLSLRLLRGGTASDGPAASPAWRGGAIEAGAGLLITLSSPFTLAFFLTILTSLADSPAAALRQLPTLLAVTLAISAAVLGAVILLAARLHRALGAAGHRRRLERGLGLLLAGATAWLALG